MAALDSQRGDLRYGARADEITSVVVESTVEHEVEACNETGDCQCDSREQREEKPTA